MFIMAYHQFVIDLHVCGSDLFRFRVDGVLLVLIIFVSLLYGLIRIPTLLLQPIRWINKFNRIVSINSQRRLLGMKGALFDVFFIDSVDYVFIFVRTVFVGLLDWFLGWRCTHHWLLKNTNILSTLRILFFV